MNFDRILTELGLVHEWIDETQHGLSQSLKTFVFSSEIPKKKFNELFDDYDKMQRDVLNLIKEALRDELNDDYKDIAILLTGSAARLEYVKGISDIDTFGLIVDRPKQQTAGEPNSSDKVQAREEERKSKLQLFDQLKERLGLKGISLGGVPYLGQENFGTQEEVFNKLGEFDEPSWSVVYRANVMLESVAFARQADAQYQVEEIAREVNRIYCVSADLRQKHFPFLGAILIGFLCKGGVLAKVSRLKSQEEGSQKAKEERTLEKEIIKTLSGRTWSSAVHLVMLHVLYWYILLRRADEPDLKAEEIKELLGRSPLFKITKAIPKKFNAINRNVQKEKWRDRTDMDPQVRDAIRSLFSELYHRLNPPSRADAQAKRTLAGVYIPFILTSMYTRIDTPSFGDEEYDKLVAYNATVAECLSLCEEVTLLLATEAPFKRPDGIRYLRLFGTEVFDKTTYMKRLGGEIFTKSPKAQMLFPNAGTSPVAAT